MQFNTLFFLLVISSVCFAFAQVSYDDCCLKYVRNMDKRTQKHAVRYTYQKTDGGCNIPAVIFIMRKGRKFCADPDDRWAKNLMQMIDKRAENYNKKPKRKYSYRG